MRRFGPRTSSSTTPPRPWPRACLPSSATRPVASRVGRANRAIVVSDNGCGDPGPAHGGRLRGRRGPVSGPGGATAVTVDGLRAPGLLAGVLALGPVLLHRGFTLSYDMVFVPGIAVTASTWGMDGSVPRAVPERPAGRTAQPCRAGRLVQKAFCWRSSSSARAGAARFPASVPGAARGRPAVRVEPLRARAAGHRPPGLPARTGGPSLGGPRAAGLRDGVDGRRGTTALWVVGGRARAVRPRGLLVAASALVVAAGQRAPRRARAAAAGGGGRARGVLAARSGCCRRPAAARRHPGRPGRGRRVRRRGRHPARTCGSLAHAGRDLEPRGLAGGAAQRAARAAVLARRRRGARPRRPALLRSRAPGGRWPGGRRGSGAGPRPRGVDARRCGPAGPLGGRRPARWWPRPGQPEAADAVRLLVALASALAVERLVAARARGSRSASWSACRCCLLPSLAWGAHGRLARSRTRRSGSRSSASSPAPAGTGDVVSSPGPTTGASRGTATGSCSTRCRACSTA